MPLCHINWGTILISQLNKFIIIVFEYVKTMNFELLGIRVIV